MFGQTGGTCVQNGSTATNDYTFVQALWFNPVANAYYAVTTRFVQVFSTTDANFCKDNAASHPNPPLFVVGRATTALVRIAANNDD